MDAHDWVSVIVMLISIPIAYFMGILTNLHAPRFGQFLDRRKLLKQAKTKKQALVVFNRIKSFRDGTRDRYPFYIILASSAIICATIASTLLLMISIQNGGLLYSISIGYIEVALIAIIALLFAILLLVGLYDTARQIERFDAYKIEFEKRWGSVNSSE